MSAPNPSMLMLAREARGLTQSELSKSARVSQPALSRYETGLTPIPDEHLARLAEVLGFPVSFFLQTDAVYPHGSSCLYHRKRVTIRVGEFRRLLARFNVLRMQVERLLRGLEIAPTNQFQRFDIAEYNSAARVAQLARGMWNLPAGPITNIIAVIESTGGLVLCSPFDTAKLDAFSQWLPGLPPLFFVNSTIPTDRMRWTLAHEIGHLIMHRIPSSNLEQEADEFAAEFLMPECEISHQLHPMSLSRAAGLKPFWRVSMAAIVRRAKELRRITDSQYRRLFTELSRLGYRTAEPYPLEPEEPTLLSRMIEIHRQQHGYDVHELARITNADPEEFANAFLEKRRLRLVE